MNICISVRGCGGGVGRDREGGGGGVKMQLWI